MNSFAADIANPLGTERILIPDGRDATLMSHLIINTNSCIGCKRCSRACPRNNLAMVDGRAVETGGYCIDCGHCIAVCPRDSIRLTAYPDGDSQIRDYDEKQVLIPPETLLDFLQRRRSCRWFTDDKLPEETFLGLQEAAACSPTADNAQDVELVVLDGRLNDFLQVVWDIIKTQQDQDPRIRQFGNWIENPASCRYHPLLWQGKQVLCTFARRADDGLLAAGRMEMLAYSAGLGGFYSKYLPLADEIDHGKVATFFPDLDPAKRLQAAFVIGQPVGGYFRRTVPRREPPLHMY